MTKSLNNAYTFADLIKACMKYPAPSEVRIRLNYDEEIVLWNRSKWEVSEIREIEMIVVLERRHTYLSIPVNEIEDVEIDGKVWDKLTGGLND